MRRFGTAPDGSDVDLVEIGSDRITARIVSYGARLQFLAFDGSGDLTRGSDDIAAYAGPLIYRCPIVAPVVNRIAGARAKLGGRTLEFEANQNGRHSLHSGSTGAHNRVWAVDEAGPDAVRLTLDMADGEGGFPGARRIAATYRVAGSDLHLDLEASTDRPTLMNPAFHGTWNLDATDDWSGHRLMVPAGRILETDAEIVPTGRILDVGETPFDLRDLRGPPATIDHNYCFDEGAGFGLRARLVGGRGLSMDVLSDSPGLQIFSQMRDTIAIEPQLWPDAPNHAGFPSIVLREGEVFRQRSVYRFATA